MGIAHPFVAGHRRIEDVDGSMITSVTSSGFGTVTLGNEVIRSIVGSCSIFGNGSIFDNSSILVRGSLFTGTGRLARLDAFDHVHSGHEECGAVPAADCSWAARSPSAGRSSSAAWVPATAWSSEASRVAYIIINVRSTHAADTQ